MAFRDNLAKLRSLAGESGYRLEKAPISGTWFLVDEATGEKAMSDRGTKAFSATTSSMLHQRSVTPAAIAGETRSAQVPAIESTA